MLPAAGADSGCLGMGPRLGGHSPWAQHGAWGAQPVGTARGLGGAARGHSMGPGHRDPREGPGVRPAADDGTAVALPLTTTVCSAPQRVFPQLLLEKPS